MSDVPQVLLAHHLKTLKLPTFLREHDKLARLCAAEGVDHPTFLLRLAELELLDRERRMVERRIRQARFPVVKSLDSFDFAALPSLNPCGSHSPPLAALIARVSETDVLLTTGRRLAHLYNTPPLGAGILYCIVGPLGFRQRRRSNGQIILAGWPIRAEPRPLCRGEFRAAPGTVGPRIPAPCRVGKPDGPKEDSAGPVDRGEQCHALQLVGELWPELRRHHERV